MVENQIEQTQDNDQDELMDNTRLELLYQEMNIGNPVKFTEEQIDEIIKQKAEVNKYIHEERMQNVQTYKLEMEGRFRVLVVVLIFFLIFSGGVGYFKPEYLGEVITGILGLLGGSGLGFGLGKMESSKE